MQNPIFLASKAKGPTALIKRVKSVTSRYGLTTASLARALCHFSDVLQKFGCGATFPLTAVALERHSDTITKYLDQNIEFAVHGYTHVDYSQLTPNQQLDHMILARQIFFDAGIEAVGFRSPYLSRNAHLYSAIEAAGFSYMSNLPFLWDALDSSDFELSSSANYRRAIDFYNPWLANEKLALPRQVHQLIEIPVSLPDDEILVDRLGEIDGLVRKTWLRILVQTHQRGELFTLQLHPERIYLCADGLSAVLEEASRLTPSVWCARLDEIATWWRVRNEAYLHITKVGDDEFNCIVTGPPGTTILVRATEVNAHTEPWADGYREVKTDRFTCYSSRLPLIGSSQSTSTELVIFLRQQGYIIEVSQEPELYSYYIHQIKFDTSQECLILNDIEESGCPLIRFGRWPYGAKSALAITGDIDALTIWDYGLRLIGK